MDSFTENLIEKSRQRRAVLEDKIQNSPGSGGSTRKRRTLEKNEHTPGNEELSTPAKRALESDNDKENSAHLEAGMKTRLARLAKTINSWEDDLGSPRPKDLYDDKPVRHIWTPPAPLEYEVVTRSRTKSQSKLTTASPASTQKPMTKPVLVSDDSDDDPDQRNICEMETASESDIDTHTDAASSAPEKSPRLSSQIEVVPSKRRSSGRKGSFRSEVKFDVSRSVKEQTVVLPTNELKQKPSISVRQHGNKNSAYTEIVRCEKPPSAAADTNDEEEPTEEPVAKRLQRWRTRTGSQGGSTEQNQVELDDPSSESVTSRMAKWQNRASKDMTPSFKTPVGKKMEAKKTTPKAKSTAVTPMTTRARVRESPPDVTDSEAEPTNKPLTTRLRKWEQFTADSEKDSKGIPVRVTDYAPSDLNDSADDQVRRMPTTRKRSQTAGAVKMTEKKCSPPKKPALSSASKGTASSPRVKTTPTGSQPPAGKPTSTKMKQLQQTIMRQLEGGWRENDIAEKTRQQKQEDMEVVQNRWKQGIVRHEPLDLATPPEPKKPPAAKAPVVQHHHNAHGGIPVPPPMAPSLQHRSPTKSQKDFENNLIAMGYQVAGTAHDGTPNRVATLTLDDNHQQQQEAQPRKPPRARSSSQTQSNSVTTVGRVVDTQRHTNVRFSPHTQVTVRSNIDYDNRQYYETEEDSEQSSYSDDTENENMNTGALQPSVVSRQLQYTANAPRRSPRLIQRAYSQSTVSSSDAESRDMVTTETEDTSQWNSAEEDEDDGGQDSDDELDDLIDEALDDTTDDDGAPASPEPERPPRQRRSARLLQQHKPEEPPQKHYLYSATVEQTPEQEEERRQRRNERAISMDEYRLWQRKTATYRSYDSMESFESLDFRDDTQSMVTYSSEDSAPIAPPPRRPRLTVDQQIKQLEELQYLETKKIEQASKALSQCGQGSGSISNPTASSLVLQDAQIKSHEVLLVATQKRHAYISEIDRLRNLRTVYDEANDNVSKGALIIDEISLPLRSDFIRKRGTVEDSSIFYFICLIRHGPDIKMTQTIGTHDSDIRDVLYFPNRIMMQGVTGGFRVNIEIYSMSVSRDIVTPSKKQKKTPAKKLLGSMVRASPGGPYAVRTTNFSLVSSVTITKDSIRSSKAPQPFALPKITFSSPLAGRLYLSLQCQMESNVTEEGFLTMYEDVRGLGAWHRRWFVLRDHKLRYWKYPEDIDQKAPIGCIELKRCQTRVVEPLSREKFSRPNTVELVIVRDPIKGDHDSLVSRSCETVTLTRYLLSADTKDERILWCNKLNEALRDVRHWNPDAVPPAKQ